MSSSNLVSECSIRLVKRLDACGDLSLAAVALRIFDVTFIRVDLSTARIDVHFRESPFFDDLSRTAVALKILSKSIVRLRCRSSCKNSRFDFFNASNEILRFLISRKSCFFKNTHFSNEFASFFWGFACLVL